MLGKQKNKKNHNINHWYKLNNNIFYSPNSSVLIQTRKLLKLILILS